MDWLTRPDMKYIGRGEYAPDPVDANVVYMAVGTYTFIGQWPDHPVGRSGKHLDPLQHRHTHGGKRRWRSLGERLMVDPNKTSILYFGSRTAGSGRARILQPPGPGRQLPRDRTNPYGLSFVVLTRRAGPPGVDRRPSTWAWQPRRRAPISIARPTPGLPGHW